MNLPFPEDFQPMALSESTAKHFWANWNAAFDPYDSLPKAFIPYWDDPVERIDLYNLGYVFVEAAHQSQRHLHDYEAKSEISGE